MESPTGDTFAIRHACGAVGPSPRMWGIRAPPRPPVAYRRFIPTHVGNSRLQGGLRERREVHPHACGEYLMSGLSARNDNGSSPRMWGILSMRLLPAFPQRFIPTHVGNTTWAFITYPITKVHPHACGEYAMAKFQDKAGVGSSPRMWGIQSLLEWLGVAARFIPTHVGNTTTSRRGMYGPSVHPHACGEYAIAIDASMPAAGSSPRMWGIRPTVPPVSSPGRFIPTHVGNTWPHSRSWKVWSVHPHACGEYLGTVICVLAFNGSSPRMWGIRVDVPPQQL